MDFLAVPPPTTFTGPVPFEFILNPASRSSTEAFLAVSGRQIPLIMVRHPRARRYLLQLRPDGTARVTIPRGGSVSEAQRFAERNIAWLEQQLQRQATRPKHPAPLHIGSEILFRGEMVRIEAGELGLIRFSQETVKANDADLRPSLERHLWLLAARELPPMVVAYATRFQLRVSRITVRNQRFRWGSCSRRGTISLNWRLIQTPVYVRDYIVVHELAHLMQMNHSERFWQQVERWCPDYATAEQWLKQHARAKRSCIRLKS
jgi:predicted metal-dependent hydrolase